MLEIEEGEDGIIPDIQPEEGGGRRRSKRISELCGRFDEGGEDSNSQSGGGEGRGEKRYSLSYRKLETLETKDMKYCPSLTRANTSKLSKDSFNIHTEHAQD